MVSAGNGEMSSKLEHEVIITRNIILDPSTTLTPSRHILLQH